jgi:hypothetical protein
VRSTVWFDADPQMQRRVLAAAFAGPASVRKNDANPALTCRSGNSTDVVIRVFATRRRLFTLGTNIAFA